MKRDVLADIDAALNDAEATIREVGADVFEDAMASVRDLLDGSCAQECESEPPTRLMRWATPDRACDWISTHDGACYEECVESIGHTNLPLISGPDYSRADRMGLTESVQRAATAESIRLLPTGTRTAHEVAWLAAYERENGRQALTSGSVPTFVVLDETAAWGEPLHVRAVAE